MIYLKITDLLLTPPIMLISVDWQVATAITFDPLSIMNESLGDAVNTSSIMFNSVLDPNTNYYARSRVLLSTGYTAWGNIDIFHGNNVGDGTTNIPLPTIVSLPSITLPNNGVNCPIHGMNIVISPVQTLGGGVHDSTTYMLETVYGNPIWASIRNVTEKLELTISPRYLTPNTIYRLRILLNTDSDDSSQLITTTFNTEQRDNRLLLSSAEYVDPLVGTNIDIYPNSNAIGVTGTLYAFVTDTPIVVNTYPAINNIINVPANDLKSDTHYIIRVNTSNPLVWDQRQFTTTA